MCVREMGGGGGERKETGEGWVKERDGQIESEGEVDRESSRFTVNFYDCCIILA